MAEAPWRSGKDKEPAKGRDRGGERGCAPSTSGMALRPRGSLAWSRGAAEESEWAEEAWQPQQWQESGSASSQKARRAQDASGIPVAKAKGKARSEPKAVVKITLIRKVKAVLKSSADWRTLWNYYCDKESSGDREPAHQTVDFMQIFLQEYEQSTSGEGVIDIKGVAALAEKSLEEADVEEAEEGQDAEVGEETLRDADGVASGASGDDDDALQTSSLSKGKGKGSMLGKSSIAAKAGGKASKGGKAAPTVAKAAMAPRKRPTVSAASADVRPTHAKRPRPLSEEQVAAQRRAEAFPTTEEMDFEAEFEAEVAAFQSARKGVEAQTEVPKAAGDLDALLDDGGELRILIEDLPEDCQDVDLEEHFCEYGDLMEATVVRGDDETPLGYGLVTLADRPEGLRVLHDPHQILGQDVRVRRRGRLEEGPPSSALKEAVSKAPPQRVPVPPPPNACRKPLVLKIRPPEDDFEQQQLEEEQKRLLQHEMLEQERKQRQERLQQAYNLKPPTEQQGWEVPPPPPPAQVHPYGGCPPPPSAFVPAAGHFGPPMPPRTVPAVFARGRSEIPFSAFPAPSGAIPPHALPQEEAMGGNGPMGPHTPYDQVENVRRLVTNFVDCQNAWSKFCAEHGLDEEQDLAEHDPELLNQFLTEVAPIETEMRTLCGAIKKAQAISPDTHDEWKAHCEVYAEGKANPWRHELAFVKSFVDALPNAIKRKILPWGAKKACQQDDRPTELQGLPAIWVGGLPKEADEETLTEHFCLYGELADVRVRRQGKPRASAIVTFQDSEDIDTLIEVMLGDDHEILGKQVIVRLEDGGPKDDFGEDQSKLGVEPGKKPVFRPSKFA
eukprot:TRINITY_DN3946_c0_g1_i2.p1 TRINITY_DN3946_c0_g1~~TRINITY_DN3946_c0_g1_i2.p1  ORF type:complete len:905 (+),score=206.56 TRINITY_DN3946_c0_g1_i2:196-2715(+)